MELARQDIFRMGYRAVAAERPERVFHRIPDLRDALEFAGIEGEEFDSLLRGARDRGELQLYAGDVTCMTVEQARKRFTDENGFTFGTFSIA